jgi:2,3-diketo-5-methylthio-1-phosphopentane phosphatase
VRATEAQLEAQENVTCPGAPYLPPQIEGMKGRLTVVLDLDGTLISSFTPRRAPSLAPGSTSYVCGRGAKLNPNGVLVVERPDLGAFLKRLSEFAEVVLFTAGLEDYAAPICDALEKRYGVFTAKLFRPATVHSEVYPCVKDLSMLGRDLARIVLIDDTPLAFLNQPDNGIPIYNFRGDIDDRVLPEAILPLLDQLAAVDDVRPVLHRRFDMPRWLASHGLTLSRAAKTAASPVKRRLRLVPGKAEPEEEKEQISETLILSDFDQTLTDCDAGERLVGELAPELVPMLAALQQPANFVPLTNAVLSEMARRGISEEVLNVALQKMGKEIPSSSLKLLQWAAQHGVDFRLISDCNTLFISQILTGARVNLLVKEVITNPSAFEKSTAHDSAVDLTRLDACTSGHGSRDTHESARRLVIQPRHRDAASPHCCPICPANLCKGKEVAELRKRAPYKRIIYLGDGANDLCPALNLRSGDAVLARRGFPLDTLLEKALQNDGKHTPDGRSVSAQVHTWESHAQMLELVRRLV